MNMSAVCVGAGAAPIDEVAVGRVVGLQLLPHYERDK
jgi:hypothetical protein